ncbi:MAG: D-alanine--D-alanine ligase family protein, partial [Niameybacter sp.]
ASSEYEVSLLSVSSILENIDNEKYNIIKIGITKQGTILYYTGDISDIKSGEWCKLQDKCTPCDISTSSAFKGITTAKENIAIDVIFPVLHGKNGEDGTMQGLLTIAGIPFVGCDTVSSAICMDKEYTHIILNGVVPMAKYVSTTEYNFTKNSADIINRCEQELLYPMFVKPANAGSSVGVSKASNRADLIAAIRIAFTHDKKIVIEEMLTGREVECAVLGNNDPRASIPGDIEPCNEWYDYNAKYIANKSNCNIPAKISPEQISLVQRYAVDAFVKLGCSGLSRVDFFVNDNSVTLNEINTIPGFTAISMYPKMWSETGLPYEKLIDKLIMLALGKEE